MSELFITCAEHLEPLLLEELKRLNIPGLREGFRGVYAFKNMETVYAVNYLSRLATRVLWPLHTFHCRDRDELYREAKTIDWLDYLDPSKTFAIDANISHPTIRHSLYGAQVVKDALCDVLREKRGARPSVNVQQPDVQLNLFIHNNRAIISLDTSGSPLYKRGWKERSGDASLQETLAAAMLQLARYNPEETFCDPFCGAGTLLVEAALIATHTPPGFFRESWGFMHMPQFSQQKWEEIKQFHDQKRIPLPKHMIMGADRDRAELSLCKANLARLGWAETIELKHAEVYAYHPSPSPRLIITDPPFGKRLVSSRKIFEDLGQFLKENQDPQQRAFVLCPKAEMIGAIGCKIVEEFPLKHGGLDTILYQLVSGK